MNNTIDTIKVSNIDNKEVKRIPNIKTVSITEIKSSTKNYDVDENGNINLKQVSPELKNKMDQLIELCKKEGINIKITEDIRSVERQDELYEQGRSKTGKIVTNQPGSYYGSNHQWGTSFDICINDKNNAYNEEMLKRVGEIGRSIGLAWGGDWEMVDMPHFELPNADEIKKRYNDPSEYADTWK